MARGSRTSRASRPATVAHAEGAARRGGAPTTGAGAPSESEAADWPAATKALTPGAPSTRTLPSVTAMDERAAEASTQKRVPSTVTVRCGASTMNGPSRARSRWRTAAHSRPRDSFTT